MGLKALILVGGFGTRLRPLTLTVPKPLIDFCNEPMVIHQIKALKSAGVDEVVLAINYRPEMMQAFCKEWETKLGVKITISQETEPMGTAGPLALARDILSDGTGQPFFVLNSDVICEFPFKEMLQFHKEHDAEATILVTKVEDPSKYGVVVMDDTGKVDRFVEKPKEFVGDKINAGIYCLDAKVLDRIELRPTSIEKEVFPAVAADKALYAMTLPGYWMDVGQPKDYLIGLKLHLETVSRKQPELLSKGEHVMGSVIIDETAEIGEGCKIGPNVSIGKMCKIGDGVRISNAVILHRVEVKSYARINDSIVGWGSKVGKWAFIDDKCVIGEDVTVRDEILLNGAVILPHKEIKESSLEHGKIHM